MARISMAAWPDTPLPVEPLLLPSLPFELIEEILQRTPAVSLIRFKSTCKRWYHLISSDNRFMQSHLDNSPEQFIRIDSRERVQIIDPVTGSLSVTPIPDVFRDMFMCMCHCDGLLLCLCHGLRGDLNLAVWNPLLRKSKWIKPLARNWSTARNWLTARKNCEYIGIGYSYTSRDNYKILRFSYHDDDDDDKSEPFCHVYELKSDSWRSIDAKFDGNIDAEVQGVSVNGNMYWVDGKKKEKKNEHFIICFDFTMETFKHVCVSPPYSDIELLGCFNGDRLSLLQHDEVTGEIHVSVTNKLTDGLVSFSRYFIVTLPDLPMVRCLDFMVFPGWCIGKQRNIMAWCEQIVKEDGKMYTCITLYEIDEGGVRKQIETGRREVTSSIIDPLITSYVYVPSLIPVPV
ncbi:PREDICTED: putative F-box protein At3g10430 [Camelina sativa]|uniref:F-box protein At3g10430 n=1 Tax=Camelina sativa TaxID=90675 RepID=A0ABM1RBF9_CAMSA|nr:PREDICTED: putative F-box protein At3g10430 [Camelina sativa]